jgi:hypothetical protein
VWPSSTPIYIVCRPRSSRPVCLQHQHGLSVINDDQFIIEAERAHIAVNFHVVALCCLGVRPKRTDRIRAVTAAKFLKIYNSQHSRASGDAKNKSKRTAAISNFWSDGPENILHTVLLLVLC